MPEQAWTLCSLALLTTCTQSGIRPELRTIYNCAAQQIGDERTPVVVLPGALGSRLRNASIGKLVGEAFRPRAVNAGRQEGARDRDSHAEGGAPRRLAIVRLPQLRSNTAAPAIAPAAQMLTSPRFASRRAISRARLATIRPPVAAQG